MSSSFRPSQPSFAPPGKPYKKNLALVDVPMARPERNFLSKAIYELALKRQSTYVLLVGGLAFTYDYGIDRLFEWRTNQYNKGRTFEDVMKTFPKIPPGCDDDDDDEDE